ncbi:hypothetical protein CW368_08675 [Actinomycetales bacterium SN12]|nr:hypothetical protein CW368_08675 [Actinomycetales bacterium SN12]
MSAATRSTGQAIARSAEPTAPPQAADPTASTEPAIASEPSPQPTPAEPAYELVDIDRYEVFEDGPVGYVEVIPPLFICYSGHPYPKAIEVAQVFDFEQAVRRVREAAPHSHGSHENGRTAA